MKLIKIIAVIITLLSLFNCHREKPLIQKNKKFKVHNLSKYDLTDLSVYSHSVGNIISGEVSPEYLVAFDNTEAPIMTFKALDRSFFSYIILDSSLSVNNVYLDSVIFKSSLVYLRVQ